MAATLPLPLYLVVPRGFGQTCCPGHCDIACVSADGEQVARILCEPQDERKLLGFIPTYDVVTVSVFGGAAYEQGLIAQGEFHVSGGIFANTTLRLPRADGTLYEAVTDWYGVDACVRSEHGDVIGTVGLLHALSNALEVRGADGSALCVARTLPRRRARALAFDVPSGREIHALEESEAELDARLIVAWFYALSMRVAASS